MAQDHNHEVQHDFTPKVPQTHLDRLREAHASGVKGYVEISASTYVFQNETG